MGLPETPNAGGGNHGDASADSMFEKAKYDREALKEKRAREEKIRSEYVEKGQEGLPALRERLKELSDQMKSLNAEQKDYLQQRKINRPNSTVRYVRGSRYPQMQREAHEEYSAKLRLVAEELAPLESEYANLNRIYQEITGKYFGEWLLSHGKKDAKDTTKPSPTQKESPGSTTAPDRGTGVPGRMSIPGGTPNTKTGANG